MRRGRTAQLGQLERAVMEELWRAPDGLTVRQIATAFPDSAYTTILTVCDRLSKKNLVTRTLVGRSHVYRPSAPQEEYIAMLMVQALDGSSDREAALVRFMDAMDPREMAVLRSTLRRRTK